MGSVLAYTKKYREAFPGDFKKGGTFEHILGDVQITDPEIDKQFSGTFEQKENKDLSGAFTGYKDFNRPFIRGKDFPADDTIVINPYEKDILQRKRTIVHETTHKISRAPDTFSTNPNPNDIIDTYFPERKTRVEKILDTYKPEKRWGEMLSIQSEISPKSLYLEPKEDYEKEFHRQFNNPTTQRRLYEPDLIEYPINKETNIFENSGAVTKRSLKEIKQNNIFEESGILEI